MVDFQTLKVRWLELGGNVLQGLVVTLLWSLMLISNIIPFGLPVVEGGDHRKPKVGLPGPSLPSFSYYASQG